MPNAPARLNSSRRFIECSLPQSICRTNPRHRRSIGLMASKAAAVISGSDMEKANEGPAQARNRSEATVDGNLLQLVARFLQPPAGRFHAQALHETCRCCAGVFQKNAGEVSRAHAGARGQLVDGEDLPEVIGGPGADFLDLPAIRSLQGKRGAELRLPSRPSQVENHFTRHLEG